MQVFIYNRFHTFVGFNSRFKLEMNKTQKLKNLRFRSFGGTKIIV